MPCLCIERSSFEVTKRNYRLRDSIIKDIFISKSQGGGDYKNDNYAKFYKHVISNLTGFKLIKYLFLFKTGR